MSDKQAIAFGYFKGDNLIGFRADTFGSVRDKPKIYHYSNDQVKIVLEGTQHITDRIKKGQEDPVGDALSQANPLAGSLLKSGLNSTDKLLKEVGTFELRVVKCPDYIDNWGYPKDEIDSWLKEGNFEALETHTFEL